MSEVMICKKSAVVAVDGVAQRVRRGRTLAADDHPVVRQNPDLWQLLPVDYPSPAPDQLPVVEVVGVDTPDDEDTAVEPKAADVRAWATAEGIDVPARGKLPADLVERYKAAHGNG